MSRNKSNLSPSEQLFIQTKSRSNNGLYRVWAGVYEDRLDKKEFRIIWQFNSISASDRYDAIRNCKITMKSVMGALPSFIWKAESEWENNLGVN